MHHWPLTSRKAIVTSNSFLESLQQPPFLFEQIPYVPFAHEDDENKETRQEVDDVRWYPNPFASHFTGYERNNFHHP